jgi:hypothetical protein
MCESEIGSRVIVPCCGSGKKMACQDVQFAACSIEEIDVVHTRTDGAHPFWLIVRDCIVYRLLENLESEPFC